MRFSQLLNNTTKKAAKGKDISLEIADIKEVIEGAVVTYKGTSKGALKANKNQKVLTIEGTLPMSVLDNESLLVIIAKQHRAAVVETCATEQEENFSMNAELCRAIATNGIILGAVYHLTNESEGNNLL